MKTKAIFIALSLFCLLVDWVWGLIALVLLSIYAIAARKNNAFAEGVKGGIPAICNNPALLGLVIGILIWREINVVVGIICISAIILFAADKNILQRLSRFEETLSAVPQYKAIAIIAVFAFLLLNAVSTIFTAVLAVITFIVILVLVYRPQALKKTRDMLSRFNNSIENSYLLKDYAVRIGKRKVAYAMLLIFVLLLNTRQVSLLGVLTATSMEVAEVSNSGESNLRVCHRCGKTFLSTDKYFDVQKGYHISCSLNSCAKCSAEIARQNDEKAWKEGIKKARNKWVDDNPNEARRRGIQKF